MDKLKILIVSRSFYPENSPRANRTTELVKEFGRQGHDVTLLTNERDFDYKAFTAKHNFKIESFGKLEWTSFKRSKIFGDYPRKFNRLLFLLGEYPNIEIMFKLKNVLPKYSGYDLLITVAVPHPVHWGTALARTPSHAIAKTWVADCGDPFMGNTLESIKPPFYFGYLERLFCKKADYISVPTEGSKNGYYKEFHDKIVVIPQGFNFKEYDFAQSEVKNPVPNFAYAGGLGQSGIRNPIPFAKYLLSTGKNFKFHVYSRNSSMLNSLIESANGKIILHEPIDRELLLKELTKMDFLVNFDNGSKNQTPSKLIDYAIVQKPVLNFLAENLDTKKIEAFLSGDYSQQMEIPNLSSYEIGNVASKFIQLTKR